MPLYFAPLQDPQVLGVDILLLPLCNMDIYPMLRLVFEQAHVIQKHHDDSGHVVGTLTVWSPVLCKLLSTIQ